MGGLRRRVSSGAARPVREPSRLADTIADADDAALGDEAWALARELAAGPTIAFGEIKNLLLSTWSQPIEAQMEQEARAIARVARTEDAWNGICEVAARRKPRFVGR